MIRVLLFLLTNLAVTIILCILSFFIGIQNHNLYMFIISTFIFGFSGSFISLLLSKKIALLSIKSYIIKNPRNKTEKWLLKFIEKQAKKLEINTPELTIYTSNDINAFATGPTKNSSLIALSDKLIDVMNKNEIKAVISHEITHISNGDMVTMTLIQGIVNTFVIFLSKGIAYIISYIFSDNKNNGNIFIKNNIITLILTLFLEILFGTLSNCITMWFSRKREFYADAGSAKIVGKKHMISALKTINNHVQTFIKEENLATLSIHGKNKKFLNLFMSHPTIKNRIKALNNKTYM
ncbi:protease HtpX [Buchnera aphidicola (Periphyllus koelreuteriae)]|uniref:protease HtpX n=1 Tax=Buchnera aphidicola TaxID=9 RepID=UPI0031B807CF